MGIYNYYAEVIPGQYPILKPLMIFLPGGDKKKGLEQLETAAQKARYARVEAQYFLLQTYFSYERQFVRALEIAQELRNRYPRNPLFHRMYGRCYVSLGYWAEAFRVFSEVEEKYRTRQAGYDVYDGREAYYYLGRHLFLAGRFDEALRNFQRCDEISRRIDKSGSSGFMSMANLMMGMIYDVQKKRGSAQAQYQKVLEMKEYESTHKEARRYMEQPYMRTQ
jgi:tetratricopeptide (TPR) repeat protein